MTPYGFASRTAWARTAWPIDEFTHRRAKLPGEWITVTDKTKWRVMLIEATSCT
jgi:hypothetical protein